MRPSIVFGCVLTAVAAAPATATVIASYTRIAGALGANDMSPDGRYVVGETDLNGDFLPDGTYLWDAITNTMTLLPAEGLHANAVSDDGTVILGDLVNPDIQDPTIGTVAGIWTAETGWESIGYLPNAGECPSRSDGYELSADGTVAVGLSWDGCIGRGYRWTQATGMIELQILAMDRNRASVLSADGNLIGGFAQGTMARTPTYWSGAGAGQLLDPPNGDARGEVMGMRDDGQIMLGTWGTTEPINRAVKWTLGESGWTREMLGTGSLGAANQWQGIPMDIANTGTIVGFDSLLGNRIGWILVGGTPPYQNLRTYIIAHGAVVPASDVLPVCQAISTNGRYIIGHGGGFGWRVTLDLLGDMNCDGSVDAQDVDSFVQALVDPAAYTNAFPACAHSHADMSQDGAVNGQDVSGFVIDIFGP